MGDVAEWLEKLGLAEYAERFAANRIDFPVLRELTDEDLKGLGMVLGDRRRLLRAVRDLDAGQPAAAGAAERRQLSVVFCDLVGSTALSARLDPEDLRSIVSAYHRCCAGAIEREGGFVAQYLGDGVLAYFGYPRADEHDAERAVQAGLAIVEAVPRLDTVLGEPLGVRVGIATGLVVVGDLIGSGDARQRSVIGETPNLAARVQGVAGTGMVAIADATRRLLGNLFELRDLGDQELKGIPEPVRVWAVTGTAAVPSRFEALRYAEGRALVGRGEELGMLLDAWSRAKRREGSVTRLSGEPGIGKSRLVAALAERVAADGGGLIHFSCSPHHGSSALFPVAAELDRAWAAGEDTRELRARLAREGGREQRERTLEALVRRVLARSEGLPLLVVFEDAHWSDPTTMEYLRRLEASLPGHAILLVVTFRPGSQSPWQTPGRAVELRLERLCASAAEAIVDRVLDGRTLPMAARRAILERSDGIPLFVEEITKAALDAEGHAVPSSLLASLTSRLDRLGPAKELAQIAAAIGREFPHPLLAAVANRDAAQLGADLERLVAAGLVLREGASYVFNHALVQDAAYGSLLREARRALHLRIAQALQRFPDSRPEDLARHYGEGGEPRAAALHWASAGRQSLARSALTEAAEQLGTALGLIGSLPGSPELRRDEARLQIELANALIHIRGHAHAQTRTAFARARAFIERAERLGEPLDDPLLPYSVLYGHWVASRMGFDGNVMRDLAGEFLALAQMQKATAPRMIGHMVVGISSALLGELEDAQRHLDRAIELYDPASHRALGTRFGHDVRVSAYCWRALARSLLGHREAALEDASRALADAGEIGHAATSMFALSHVGLLYLHTGRLDDAARLYGDLIVLADAKGSAYWKSYGVLLQGWHCTHAGRPQAALELLRAGASAMRSTGATAYAPWYLACMAQALARLGHLDEAREHLGRARAAMASTNERWWASEVDSIHREIDGLGARA